MNRIYITSIQNGLNRCSALLTRSFTKQTQAAFDDSEYKNAKPYSKIPRPSIFACMKTFFFGDINQSIQAIDLQISLQKEYGPIIRFPGYFGHKDLVTTYDPKDFETVFRSEGPFPYRRGVSAFDYFRRNVRPEVYKNVCGLFNDHGEAWGHMRSVVNPIMLKPKTVKAYIPVIDEVAKDFVAKIKSMKDSNQEMPVNFGDELSKWTLESIAVIALGHRLGVLTNDNDPDSQKIIKSVKDVLTLGFQAELLPTIWKYVHTPMFDQLMDGFNTLTDITKEYVDNAIERKLKGNIENIVDGDDSVLGKLLKINPDYAFVMTVDMLLAGIDTTATSVANLLYHLAENPLKQVKLRQEVMSILPEIDSKLTPSSLNSVPYMRACLKETLRLTPPTPGNMRRTENDLVLQGYQIPKNTDVFFCASVHLDELHFKNSREFIPERWLSIKEMEGCQDNGTSHHPFSCLPFGFGVRSCLGKRYAEMEATLLIFRILREFKVEWHYGPLKYLNSFVMAPTNDLKFKMIPLK